jgi:hypothetical protein
MRLFEAEYLLAYQPSNSWVHFDVWPDVWMVADDSESFQGVTVALEARTARSSAPGRFAQPVWYCSMRRSSSGMSCSFVRGRMNVPEAVSQSSLKLVESAEIHT